MVKMHENLKNEYITVGNYGCSAHCMNILEEEITSQEMIGHVLEEQTYFRNPISLMHG